MMKNKFVLIIAFLLILPVANAKQGHMKILSVAEISGEYKGGVADLILETRQGNGNVFIDTYPLSKIDTQISTRFAKEIACKHLDKECSGDDFFYTVRSNSAIIGGPSAGAAISLLTIALLDGLEMDQSMSITGTINSGGFIGPVSGVKEKITAAAAAGIQTVLIPVGTRYAKEENGSVDLVLYGDKLGISVEEVSNLDQALYKFTGKEFDRFLSDVEVTEEYQSIMTYLAEDLCSRADKLKKSISPEIQNLSIYHDMINLTKKSRKAAINNKHYASASYCFGANVKANYLSLISKNLTSRDVYSLVNATRRAAQRSNTLLVENDYKTISDLETFMVIKERITEAEDYVNRAMLNLDDNMTEAAIYNIAYANERIYSARSWSNFYGITNRKFVFDNESLKHSCVVKLSEAEERLQYIQTIAPRALKDTKKDLSKAYQDMRDGHYELCLFKASKTKAEVDVVLTVFGVMEEQLDTLILNKLDIAKKSIMNEKKKGMFPIMGYSYYEYASMLREDNPYSALIYLEYSLELSNLDMYFKEKTRPKMIFDWKTSITFIFGALFGLVLGMKFACKKMEPDKLKAKKH